MNDKYLETNLKNWNERVAIHAKSKEYDLAGFKQGKTSLFPIEQDELGDVNGKTLLHLQCHFGLDTLSWARKGAIVTGVDFSSEAITLARKLSEELSIPATFIESNILTLPESRLLSEHFDIVFTSYGVLCWLEDLEAWANTINTFLKPGGTFYVIDSHPLGLLIDETVEDVFQVGYPYFTYGKPIKFDESFTYTEGKELANQTTYEWFHGFAEIMNPLLQQGLKIEFVHEFPFGFFPIHPNMKQQDDGYWDFIDKETFNVPMIFSLKAIKPLSSDE